MRIVLVSIGPCFLVMCIKDWIKDLWDKVALLLESVH